MEAPEAMPPNFDLRALFVEDDRDPARSEIDDRLFRLVKRSGQRSGRIVILPAACPDPIEQGRRYARRLLVLGGGLVHVLHVESRLHANDENAIALVAQATGILLLGSQRQQLISMLDETELLRTIRRRQSEGCVVAATRAGSSLLTRRADIVL